MSKFGMGRNSIQAQLTPNELSMSMKKDRDYIRNITKETKEYRSMSVSGDKSIHEA